MMFVVPVHIRCLLLFVILIQTVSLNPINHMDVSSLSLNENKHDDQWNTKNIFASKRSISPIGLGRRPGGLHWNPLVAAYKRCGEYVMPEERESCFKDAVQTLFVHRL